jgi:carbon storage regulator
MLVLSRKLNESIVINDNVVVTVLGVKGNTVRLGIEAPGEIPVHRQELYEKMQNQEVPMSIA